MHSIGGEFIEWGLAVFFSLRLTLVVQKSYLMLTELLFGAVYIHIRYNDA